MPLDVLQADCCSGWLRSRPRSSSTRWPLTTTTMPAPSARADRHPARGHRPAGCGRGNPDDRHRSQPERRRRRVVGAVPARRIHLTATSGSSDQHPHTAQKHTESGRTVSSRRWRRCIKCSSADRPPTNCGGGSLRSQRRPELVITARLPVVLAPCGTRLGRQRFCGTGTPFHRSPSLPRCTDARSASQATPPANLSVLALRSGGVERTRAVHGSCRDVGVGDGRNGRAAMPA